MKKTISIILALVLVLSLGVTAFAAGSPTASGSSASYTTKAPAAASEEEDAGLGLYNEADENYATVPADAILNVAVGDADTLPDADKEAFLAAYEDVKEIQDKVVKYFFWLDIPEEYKTDEFAYARYEFSCEGENVEVTVNGNPMEVESLGDNDYVAKLTEFGAVAILCD